MKIAVGLSGGVDSSTALALLQKAGNEVIGITMKIWDGSFVSSGKFSSCYGKDEEKDAVEIQKLCEAMGIKYYSLDLSEEYKKIIVEYFKMEYLSGRTPNPCVFCNQKIKFRLLLEKAENAGLSFDYFATGHYARIEFEEASKKFILKKAKYIKKDQSYFLSFLNQQQLSKTMFPLGNFTKDEVRDIARDFGLPVADKEESQDFYSGDYTELFGNSTPEQGNIIDKSGRILGRHKGICNFTIGQRRGLGISSNIPLYVAEIDKKKNTVIVGTEDDLFKNEMTVKNINWISIDAPEKIKASTRIRYLHKEAASEIQKKSDGIYSVTFDAAQKAVAPGQIAVFYDNEIVLGGGVIEK